MATIFRERGELEGVVEGAVSTPVSLTVRRRAAV